MTPAQWTTPLCKGPLSTLFLEILIIVGDTRQMHLTPIPSSSPPHYHQLFPFLTFVKCATHCISPIPWTPDQRGGQVIGQSQNPDSWVMSWGYLPSNAFGHLTLEYTVCLWPESAMVAGLRERELIMVRHYKLGWSREIYVSPFAIWRLPFIFWIIKQKTFSYIPQWRE